MPRWVLPAVIVFGLALASSSASATPRPSTGPGRPPSSSSSPAWPLQSSDRRITTDFGDRRPRGAANPRRHHAGEDLLADRGTIVLAPESGRVVVLRETFYEGTGIMMIETGKHVIALGEIEPLSWVPFGVALGSQVARGQAVARVGATAQLHFELYTAGTRTNYQWAWLGAQPSRLLNPTDYLISAGGRVVR